MHELLNRLIFNFQPYSMSLNTSDYFQDVAAFIYLMLKPYPGSLPTSLTFHIAVSYQSVFASLSSIHVIICKTVPVTLTCKFFVEFLNSLILYYLLALGQAGFNLDCLRMRMESRSGFQSLYQTKAELHRTTQKIINRSRRD